MTNNKVRQDDRSTHGSDGRFTGSRAKPADAPTPTPRVAPSASASEKPNHPLPAIPMTLSSGPNGRYALVKMDDYYRITGDDRVQCRCQVEMRPTARTKMSAISIHGYDAESGRRVDTLESAVTRSAANSVPTITFACTHGSYWMYLQKAKARRR